MQANCVNYNSKKDNCYALKTTRGCGEGCPFFKTYEQQFKEEERCQKRARKLGYHYQSLFEIRNKKR